MQDMHYSAKLVIYTDEKFFGPGTVELLEHVMETHSLRKASKLMSLAYTKALKMIRTAESSLKFKLIEPKVGGIGGGGSELTKKALEAIKAYNQFYDKVKKTADEGFEEYKQIIEKMR